MEIPSILLFSVAYLISSICSCIGAIALLVSTDSEASDHPLPLSVALVLSFCISLSVFTSSTYAFLFRPALENQQPHIPIHYGVFTVGKALISIVCAQIFILSVASFLPLLWIIFSFLLFGYLYYVFAYSRPISPSIRMYLNHSYCWGLLSVNFAEIALPVDFTWSIFVYLAYLLVPVCFSVTYIAFKERFNRWGSSPFLMYLHQKRKIIEFAVGMVSSILFQNVFRVASTLTMVGFFCISVAWLGNLAMVQPSTDFGIFNFLLVNACANWAVNIFKLNGYTWLVFGACLVLFVLRWKLDTVSLRYDHICASSRDHSHAPIPITTTTSTTTGATSLPFISTMLITDTSAAADSNLLLPHSVNDEHTPSGTTMSSLHITVSHLQPQLLPPTPRLARGHSF